MRYNVDGQVVLLRAPEGPLAAYIKRFAASLSEQGYALGFDPPASLDYRGFQPMAETPGRRAA